MLRLYSTISFLLVVNACLMAQVGIDYSPKVMYGELRKATDDLVELKEMLLAPELSKTLHGGKFFKVTSLSGLSTIKFVYVGRVNACRAGGCSVNPELETKEESEYFDYFMFFDAVPTVQLVKVFNYQASHGQEVSSTSWLKQFKNYNGKEELIVGKDIDAISGATISVDAITFDVQLKTNMLREILSPSGVGF